MFQTNMKEVVLQKKEIESPIQISTREAPVEHFTHNRGSCADKIATGSKSVC